MRKPLLLAGLLFAAAVQGVSAQTFDPVNVDVDVAGPTPPDTYSIGLTVTRGQFSCGGQTWALQYDYVVTHQSTGGGAGNDAFLYQIAIPTCGPFCAVTPVRLSGAGGSPGSWITNNGLLGGVPSIIWRIPLDGDPRVQGMPEGNSWRFRVFTNNLPDQPERSLSMNDLHCMGPQTCEEAAGTMRYVFPCGEIIPPGDCAPKQFNVAQVYPALPTPLSGYPGPGCWTGGSTPVLFGSLNPRIPTTIPGVLCLKTDPETHLLDVNAFIDPACCTNLTTQFVSLRKEIPGSQKCPELYQPTTYLQFGPQNIRTWWPLMYTQPGTKFTLSVAGVCQEGPAAEGGPASFTDTWCWTVVANPESFRLLIHWLHTSAIGLLEIPCIPAEDVFSELLACANYIAAKIAAWRNAPDLDPSKPFLLDAALRAIENCEGFVFANMFMAEFVDLTGPYDYVNGTPDDLAPNGPPPNRGVPAPLGFETPSGIIGILDTFENPCGCKLIVDLEYIHMKLLEEAGVDLQ